MFITELLDILHRFTIAFQYVSKVLRTDGDGASHELRDVVATHELTVVVRISARQFEGFCPMTFFVDMGNERTGIVAIIATTTEHHPPSVARPRVVALYVGRVDFIQWSRLYRIVLIGQGGQPQVSITVPNMKHSVLTESEQEPTAIRRDAWQRGTFVHGGGIKDQLTRSELKGLRVETLLVDIVFRLAETMDELQAWVDGIMILEVGATVVDGLTVGCPARIDLKFQCVILDIHHLIMLHVVCNQVTLRVEHLDLVGIGDMEGLESLIGGIDNQRKPGMPGRIDTSREDGVRSHIDLTHLPVIGNDSTAHVLTGMKLHAVRTVVLIVVAVNALSFRSLRTEHVVVDDTLLIVFQAALTGLPTAASDWTNGVLKHHLNDYLYTFP